MQTLSPSLAVFPRLVLALSVAVLLPILMTGTAAATDLLITNGGSSKFTSGTWQYSNTYVGSSGYSDGMPHGNNLTVANTNTFLSNSASLTVGYSGSSNSMTISNGGIVRTAGGTIGSNSRVTGFSRSLQNPYC